MDIFRPPSDGRIRLWRTRARNLPEGFQPVNIRPFPPYPHGIMGFSSEMLKGCPDSEQVPRKASEIQTREFQISFQPLEILKTILSNLPGITNAIRKRRRTFQGGFREKKIHLFSDLL